MIAVPLKIGSKQRQGGREFHPASVMLKKKRKRGWLYDCNDFRSKGADHVDLVCRICRGNRHGVWLGKSDQTQKMEQLLRYQWSNPQNCHDGLYDFHRDPGRRVWIQCNQSVSGWSGAAAGGGEYYSYWIFGIFWHFICGL